jgi:hypothetical protein
MARDFLHAHPQFPDLLRIVAERESVAPFLVEKDYWLMHCLYGLRQLEMKFELKGGTSLSKGFKIIDRFSEDIDLRIEPSPEDKVKYGDKPAHRKSRSDYYDALIDRIKIPGITSVVRDKEFDNKQFNSGGIRLHYDNIAAPIEGIKEGILLEVGFDTVTPNSPKDIGSWAYDYGASRVDVIDNRALGVLCYSPGYTLVEKLQTISTKYRQEQAEGKKPKNFMRHYYDVFCLLNQKEVQDFIGTEAYFRHKDDRFRHGDNKVITENEAFILSDAAIYQRYEQAYRAPQTLYHHNQPDFADIMARIKEWAPKL